MLRRLRHWVRDEPRGTANTVDAIVPERRLDLRHNFNGTTIVVRQDRVQTLIQLKDVSAEGACGLSESPLALETPVFLQLRKPQFHAAEIRWVRNALVGFKFIRPLDPDDLARLHRSRQRQHKAQN